MKKIIFVLFLIGICNTALKNYFVDQTDKFGKYSDFYEPVKEHTGKPAQYFLCGYRFKSQKWYKYISNCNCDNKFLKIFCSLCKNHFESKTSAFEGTFCHYKDWDLKKKVAFNTNSSNSGKWKLQTMCRKGFYVSGFKSRTGFQQGEYIGLTSLLLQCRNIRTNEVYDTEYEKKVVTSTEFVKNETSFISGFMIKYLEKGHITGFLPNFEQMPILAFIDIQYEKINIATATEIIVEQSKISNPSMQSKKNIVKIGKPFSTLSNHRVYDQYLTNLQISKSLQLTIPTSSTYLKKIKGTTQLFQFNQPINTQFNLKQGIQYVITPPMSQTIVQITIKESRQVIKFKAEAILVKKSDRTNLYVYPFQGQCLGSMASELQIKYIHNMITSNIKKK